MEPRINGPDATSSCPDTMCHALSVADSVLRDAEHGLRLGQAGRIDQPCDPLASLRLTEVHPEGRAVPDDVPTNRPRRIPEEGVRLRVDLVRNVDDRVKNIAETHQFVDVLVQELLPFREDAPADELRPEVRGQRIDHDEPDREV